MIKIILLKLVKSYTGYIKENTGSFQKIDVGAMIAKNPYVGVVSDIKPLVNNKQCQWVSKGTMKIYNEVVNSVSVIMNSKNKIDLYFNSKSVDTNFAVDVELSDTYDVIGFPSGEVLALSKQTIEVLMQNGLIKYSEYLKLQSGIFLTKLFFFNDHDLVNIMKELNSQPGAFFKKGDLLVCKGKLNNKDISGELATVISYTYSKEGYLYYVEFKDSSSFRNPYENKYWIFMKNIDGKVIPDNSNQLSLDLDLEDHEIDDDYHIRQLYKEKDNKKKNE